MSHTWYQVCYIKRRAGWESFDSAHFLQHRTRRPWKKRVPLKLVESLLSPFARTRSGQITLAHLCEDCSVYSEECNFKVRRHSGSKVKGMHSKKDLQPRRRLLSVTMLSRTEIRPGLLGMKTRIPKESPFTRSSVKVIANLVRLYPLWNGLLLSDTNREQERLTVQLSCGWR